MIKNGARILDIGARSTAPWSRKITVKEEIERIIPAMEGICKIIPDEVIIRRLTSRRQCKKCGEIYNVLSLKPKVEGICDKCGSELYQRDDDTEETVRNRLKVYEDQTQPLINFYKNKDLVNDIEWKREMIPEGDIDIPVDVMIDKIMEKIKQ